MRGHRRSLRLLVAVPTLVLALGASPVAAAASPPTFTLPQRLGYAAGDDWEPAIATDSLGHVYVLWKHYDVAGAAAGDCGDPSGCDQRLLLQRSDNGGRTWSMPTALDPGEVGYDSQLVVDPADGRTVYASFLIGAKSSIGITKSTDFGRTWSTVQVADSRMRSVDKDILAVRGRDVYVAWNAAQKIEVSVSHDGGATFTDVVANGKDQLGWSLPAGGTVLPDGTVLFGWAGYTQNGGAKGPVNLYVTRSTDGGRTWSTTLLDRSGAPYPCDCSGWAFYGAQVTVASDPAGRVYALENVSTTDGGPGSIRFLRSIDGGRTWSAPVPIALAPASANQAFPALNATASMLSAAWMDNRSGAYRVELRSSSDGGATWSGEAVLSADLGEPYQSAAGFTFPYGDYFELDGVGDRTVAVWGEGPGYDGPGNIFFARSR